MLQTTASARSSGLVPFKSVRSCHGSFAAQIVSAELSAQKYQRKTLERTPLRKTLSAKLSAQNRQRKTLSASFSAQNSQRKLTAQSFERRTLSAEVTSAEVSAQRSAQNPQRKTLSAKPSAQNSQRRMTAQSFQGRAQSSQCTLIAFCSYAIHWAGPCLSFVKQKTRRVSCSSVTCVSYTVHVGQSMPLFCNTRFL